MPAARSASRSCRSASPSKWTRSSRSAPDPLDPGEAGFAHRGLHAAPVFSENSFVAFAAALERGAGIECDLRLTADGHIVIFHDPDAWRLCASRMQIGRSTLAELGRLQIGGRPIPTLPSLLTLVDGRVPLLLEVKVQSDVWRWIPALRAALANYQGRFAVMSFDARVPRLLKTNMPQVRRGLVVEAALSPLRRRLARWLASPDFVALEQPLLTQPWAAALRRTMPVYGWTITTVEQRRKAQVQADALIWESDGRP